MQKTMRLMDNNCVSFQMFLMLLSFIAVGLEGQISVDQMTLYSNNVKGIPIYLAFLNFLFCFGGGREERAQEAKTDIWHFARFNFLRLSLSFIVF